MNLFLRRFMHGCAEISYIMLSDCCGAGEMDMGTVDDACCSSGLTCDAEEEVCISNDGLF